jgi:hypothetical protein
MHDWFNIVQDKYMEPWYEESEINSFLTRAEYHLYNDMMFDFKPELKVTGEEGPKFMSSVEATQRGAELIRPFKNVVTLTSSSGKITYSDIETAIGAITGDTEMLGYILSIAKSSGEPVRYTRDNDYYSLQQNTFKAASSTKPRYRVDYDSLLFTPDDDVEYKISTVRLPRGIVKGSLDSEMHPSLHDRIVVIALTFAGISTESEALVALKQVT